MKKWNVYKDDKKKEKYFVGNEETIKINCTDKKAAKYIQDRINGVYECMDWKCEWCGEQHTDDRDYGDYVDRVDEYVGDFGTEVTDAIDRGDTHKEIREIVEEWIGQEGRESDGKVVTFGLDNIESKVTGDFDWTTQVVHENSDGDEKCKKCGKQNNDYYDMERKRQLEAKKVVDYSKGKKVNCE